MVMWIIAFFLWLLVLRAWPTLGCLIVLVPMGFFAWILYLGATT